MTNVYLSSMENQLEKLQYPIGRFVYPATVSPEVRRQAISDIIALPEKVDRAVMSLSTLQLDEPYRPGGWTRRQVVHHLADSHMNAFIRFKLALTESEPTIKPYEEGEWAKGPDYKLSPAGSLDILKHVHHRWGVVLQAITEAEWERGYIHPQYGKRYSLAQALMLYAWHGEHHLGHVLSEG